MLTVDGATGEVFAGAVAGDEQVIPEALTLRSWADQLGIDIARSDELGRPPGGVPPTPIATAAGPATREALMRTLYIKGFAGAGDLAAACSAAPDEAAAMLDAMVADGIVELASETFALSADGKSLSAEMLAADRARWGDKRADDALEAFLPLDQRVKDVVTAWQVRDAGGQQVLNDHSDLDHDAAVLADLASLHDDVAAWLNRLSDDLPRLAAYAARLERASGMVAAGEHRYIASPTVDSYHSVWFELHEELILLAGRNRADEVAAGRA
jgi:pyruvate,orthophosphate dikinase